MAFGGKKSRSIRTRLFLLLLAALLPILIIQCHIYYDRYTTRRTNELQGNLELARAVGVAFQGLVQDILHQELAIEMAVTISPPLSEPQLMQFLRRCAEDYHHVAHFSWVGPEGRVLASSDSDFIGIDISNRDYYREIVSGRDWVVSDLFSSEVAEKLIFTVTRAMRDKNGALLGLSLATIHPHRLKEVLAIHRAKDAGVSLIDSKGMNVFRYPPTEFTPEESNWLKAHPELGGALKGNEVSTTIVSGSTGKRRLVGFAPVPSIGWVAAASRSEEDVIAAITPGLVSHGSLFLVVTLFAFGIALALSGRISKSIMRLRDHALTLGRGEAEHAYAAKLSPGPSEVEELADVFNEMARKVRARESALLESEHFLRAIFDSAENAIIVLDEQQRCVAANPAAGVITGVPHKELEGRFLAEFVDSDFEVSSAWEGFLYTGRFRGEVRIRNISGLQRIVEASGVAHISPGRHLFIGHDITERKQADEALRTSNMRMSSILERMSDAFVTFDRSWRYTHVNPAAAQVLKMKPEQLLGKTIWEVWPGSYDHFIGLQFRRSVQENIPLRFENFYPEPLNMWFECRCYPTPEGLAAFFSDITERKRSEEALRKSNDELELRIHERTAELERRNLELQNFTFVAAHDLQEPIRKIQTFGDLVIDRCSDSVGKGGLDYINRMRETAARMQRVLNSLLEYSRLTSNAKPFKRVDLGQVARDAVSDFELQIRDSGASVEIGSLPKVEADPGQMVQLVQNLLGNALKFRREGERPGVKIHADCKTTSDSGKGECKIYVEDNGIGFDVKYLDKIFAPFQRLHAKHEYGGIGMGLAICSKIVERHKGAITAESTPGKGSTFIVTLPTRQGEG